MMRFAYVVTVRSFPALGTMMIDDAVNMVRNMAIASVRESWARECGARGSFAHRNHPRGC